MSSCIIENYILNKQKGPLVAWLSICQEAIVSRVRGHANIESWRQTRLICTKTTDISALLGKGNDLAQLSFFMEKLGKNTRGFIENF